MKKSVFTIGIILVLCISGCTQNNQSEPQSSSAPISEISESASMQSSAPSAIEPQSDSSANADTANSNEEKPEKETTTDDNATMILSTMGELKPRQMTLDSINEEGQFTSQSQSITFTISLPEKWEVNNIVLECIMENGENWKLGEISHPTAILNPQTPFQIIDDKFHRDDNMLPLRYSEAIRIAEHDAMLYITAWEPVAADGTAMQWYYPHNYYLAYDDYIYSMYFNSPVQESAELRAMYEEILSTIKFV